LDSLDETCYLMGQVVERKGKERIKIN
jgi:hypothetical protein